MTAEDDEITEYVQTLEERGDAEGRHERGTRQDRRRRHWPRSSSAIYAAAALDSGASQSGGATPSNASTALATVPAASGSLAHRR